ncbi:MAG: PAS domain S-box protein [Candidatus Aureabacteria bacterium]|nr:PAS domain S-box protein [Candidatus Auribacterota bacterium]
MTDFTKRLLESTKDGICVYCYDTGKIIYANRGLAEILELNLSPSRICGKLFDNIIKIPPNQKSISRLLARKDAIRGMEYNFHTLSGKEKWATLNASFEKDGQNRKTVEIILRDITEQKITARTLRDNITRFRDLLNNMISGVAVFKVVGNGRDFIFKDFNKAAEKIEKIDRLNVIGKSVADVFPGAEKSGIIKALRKVWRTGLPVRSQSLYYSDRRIKGWRDNYIYKLACDDIVAIYNDITDKKVAEERLRNSESRFTDLWENAPVAYHLLDEKGIILAVNRTEANMLGYSPEEMIGRSIFDFVLDEQKKDAKARFRKKITGHKIPKSENRVYVKKNGSRIYVIIDDVLEYDAATGNICGMRSTMVDVTGQRYKSEQFIKFQETILKLGKIDFSDISAALEKITEMDAHALKTDRVSIWFFNDEHTEIICENLFLSAKAVHEKGKKLTIDKYPRYFESLEKNRCIAAYDAANDERTAEFSGYLKEHGIKSMMDVAVRLHGKLVGIICHEHAGRKRKWTIEEQNFVSSISDYMSLALETIYRREAEDALRESQIQYRSTINSLTDALHVVDGNLSVLLANNTMASWNKRFGLKTDMVGRNLLEIYPFLSEKVIEQYKKVFKEGKPVITEEKNLFGTETIVTETWKIPIIEKGQVRKVITVLKDITDQRKLQDELLKAQKLESIGVLAGGMAHDFNNILTAILGNISLAKIQSDTGGKLYEFLDEAEKASLSAKKITQQFLTFSKGGKPIRKLVSLSGLIKDAISLSVRGSNVKCDRRISKDLWPVKIDEGQISQVISNIVINAEQAMPDGGKIRVTAENIVLKENELPNLKKGKYAKIMISDKGTGIKEEYITKVFDPYFTTKQKGLGLGLATSYSIVRNHDGLITVESKPGQGSAFTVYLPAVSGVGKKHSSKNRIYKSKGRVLFMDDEDGVRRIAKRMLEYIGYNVDLARDGTEALKKYKRAMSSGQKFDAVIMDLTIPGGMSGKEAVKHLKKIDSGAKVIVTSGYSFDPVMANFRKFGFEDYLIKPFKLHDLSKILHKAVSQD